MGLVFAAMAIILVAIGLVGYAGYRMYRAANPTKPSHVPRWYTEGYWDGKQWASNELNIPDHIKATLPRGYVAPPEPELPPFQPVNRRHRHDFTDLVSTSHDFPNLFTKRCPCGEEKVFDLDNQENWYG
jgi:hypothetical protein